MLVIEQAHNTVLNFYFQQQVNGKQPMRACFNLLQYWTSCTSAFNVLQFPLHWQGNMHGAFAGTPYKIHPVIIRRPA